MHRQMPPSLSEHVAHRPRLEKPTHHHHRLNHHDLSPFEGAVMSYLAMI